MTTAFTNWEGAVKWLLSQSNQRQLIEDCYFDPPLSAAARRFEQSQEWIATRQLLPVRPGRVLEVGAGHGISSFALAHAGWKVTALEPDPSPLVGSRAVFQLATQEGLPIRVLESFGEQIACSDSTFDLIFARQALHHAKDLKRMCCEMARVMKPNGKMIAVREHIISRKRDLQTFLESHPLQRLYGGENAFLLQEYLSAFQGAGMVVNRIIRSFESPVNYAPYTRESLREEICKRLARSRVLGALSRMLLASDAVFSFVLRAACICDRRPGRLYSFVCTKKA